MVHEYQHQWNIRTIYCVRPEALGAAGRGAVRGGPGCGLHAADSGLRDPSLNVCTMYNLDQPSQAQWTKETSAAVLLTKAAVSVYHTSA